MTPSGKLEAYKRHMESKGISHATAFPPAWHALWSLGAELPPPLFLGFVTLTLIAGCLFGSLFGLGVWLLGNRGLREMPASGALWVALISGVLFGLIMAAYYRHISRKHGLGSWATYSGPPGR